MSRIVQDRKSLVASYSFGNNKISKNLAEKKPYILNNIWAFCDIGS